MKKWIIIGIILLVIVIVSVYFYKKSKDKPVIVTDPKTGVQRTMSGSSARKSQLVTQCEAMGGEWTNLGSVWGTVDGVAGWYPNYGCTLASTK